MTEDVIEQNDAGVTSGSAEAVEIPVDATEAMGGGDGPQEAQSPEASESRDAELQSQFKRLAADFENFRRRHAIEKEQLIQFAGERILERLLGVMDNFDRAIASAEGATDIQVVVKGVEMIHRQMQELLTKEGVKQMDCKGSVFDPNQHEAVMQVDREDVADQTIADVFRAGYTLNGRVLRHAMVRVANNPGGVAGSHTTEASAESAAADPVSE